MTKPLTEGKGIKHTEDNLVKSYKKPKELDKMATTIKSILFANGVKCESDQFLYEDLMELCKKIYFQTKSQIVEQILEIKPKKSKMGYACGNCGDFLDDEVSNYCSTCGYKVKRN